jgi:hypothetical protein
VQNDSGLHIQWQEDPDHTEHWAFGNVLGASAELKRLLERYSGARVSWVQTVVVLWGAFVQRSYDADRVSFVHGNALISWLQRQPKRACDLPKIAAFLDRAAASGLPTARFGSTGREVSDSDV